MYLKDLYILGREQIQRHSLDKPELEASLLLCISLGIKKTEIYANPSKKLNSKEIKKFDHLLSRRLKREPIAYIAGEKEFYTRPFKVSTDVLIPRPETEILVEETIKFIKNRINPLVIDVGTGSGCIAVTICREVGDVSVIATDISPEALTVAQENSVRHCVQEKISFVCTDVFSALESSELFDVVVSNPPYVSDDDFVMLESDVKDYEPRLSLYAEKEGMYYIEGIVFESPRYLKPGGLCIIEIGAGQSERASILFEKAGFRDLSVIKDISGLKRVIKGTWKN